MVVVVAAAERRKVAKVRYATATELDWTWAFWLD